MKLKWENKKNSDGSGIKLDCEWFGSEMRWIIEKVACILDVEKRKDLGSVYVIVWRVSDGIIITLFA